MVYREIIGVEVQFVLVFRFVGNIFIVNTGKHVIFKWFQFLQKIEN